MRGIGDAVLGQGAVERQLDQGVAAQEEAVRLAAREPHPDGDLGALLDGCAADVDVHDASLARPLPGLQASASLSLGQGERELLRRPEGGLARFVEQSRRQSRTAGYAETPHARLRR